MTLIDLSFPPSVFVASTEIFLCRDLYSCASCELPHYGTQRRTTLANQKTVQKVVVLLVVVFVLLVLIHQLLDTIELGDSNNLWNLERERFIEVFDVDKGVRVVENPFIREEGRHSQYPWEREYLPGSYAEFPLHIVPVEDAKGSLLYNMKDDRDTEKLFFVGLSEITNKI